MKTRDKTQSGPAHGWSFVNGDASEPAALPPVAPSFANQGNVELASVNVARSLSFRSQESETLCSSSLNSGGGRLGGSVVEHLPLAQVVITGSQDRGPHRSPRRRPASPSACVSASLCVSLMNK